MNNVQVEVDNVFMVQERVLWIFENVQLVKKCVQVLSENVLFSLDNVQLPTENVLFSFDNMPLPFRGMLVLKAQHPVLPERVQVLSNQMLLFTVQNALAEEF